MPRRISAEFDTRRQAELAVEHLVQEHGLDRRAIEVAAAGDGNSAGTTPSGADRDPATGEPAASRTEGRIRVSAEVPDEKAAVAEADLRQARGA